MKRGQENKKKRGGGGGGPFAPPPPVGLGLNHVTLQLMRANLYIYC